MNNRIYDKDIFEKCVYDYIYREKFKNFIRKIKIDSIFNNTPILAIQELVKIFFKQVKQNKIK